MQIIKKLLTLCLAAAMLLSLPFTVSAAGRMGDPDGDGAVTAMDARLILRASVDLEQFTPEQTALSDVDRDGDITAMDARTVLRASVDLETLEEEPEQSDELHAAALVYKLLATDTRIIRLHYIFLKDNALYFSAFVKISEEGGGDGFGVAYFSDTEMDGYCNLKFGNGFLCLKEGVPMDMDEQSLSYDLDALAEIAETLPAPVIVGDPTFSA